ncbi:unnamed protein product [Bursaphelenchus xylophilus]|uniref:(pine wood nematode) hypothetical protein n=1 Tax=Bursaphelenchus xylophilus TaxID=6326 RepID=A0A1I7SML2_BURXY|nr:unnamed protein product [Bursaphelenchus xylophilus]CAG9130271.1 unnamed protein product [Bursaphelenchus xylophilus]
MLSHSFAAFTVIGGIVQNMVLSPFLLFLSFLLAQMVGASEETCEAMDRISQPMFAIAGITLITVLTISLLIVSIIKFKTDKVIEVEARLFSVMDSVLQHTIPILLTEEMLFRSHATQLQQNAYHESLK